ncbi:helix-turn-helix domain-containing protein [Halorussus caseinilyticus]|uniref:helix-turn-helix domain-containing protein n=1 Tax=Halorussus caseinilyticus TaxID=3034025 RepID=UPI0023E8B981|nr:helix-turn-helix domain-containing protein [Halorussus sp. DT72]
MARAENTELIDDFEQFYRRYYSDEIGELAQNYPNEQRSLYVDWTDLYRYDADLADDFISQPEQLQEYAEEALRLYDLPVDVSLGQAHVRIENLGQQTDIRDIRARHVNNLVSVQGIVRKATNVRPKIQEAAFECQRCGTLTYIPQSGGDFQEPHECQGCERQGPFQINFDQSEFVDSQKIRVQESPEGLRGGETPQSIDVHIEDDITGEVTPGDHVRVTGVLHLEQQGSGQDKSAVFDVYMDGMSVTIEDEEFEDMDITDEDKKEIVELSQEDDIYEQMVDSMAPAIYGYEQEKLAMILQLFSGVTKHLPDESRIRGDLHMLLIGDPGTGKCVRGDTKVTLADGTERPIGEVVESNLTDPEPIDDGVYQEVDIPLPSMDDDGTLVQKRATKVWKREAPDKMYLIRTTSGTELEVTPSHPLFVQSGGTFDAVRAEDLREDDFVATPRTLPIEEDDTLNVDYRRSKSHNAVRLESNRKSASAEAVDEGTKNTNADVIPALSDELRRLRESLALSQSECGLARSTYQHYERGDRNPSRKSLKTLVTAFENRLERLRELSQKVEEGDWEAVETARRELHLSQQELADGIGVCQRSVSLYEQGDVAPDGGRVTDAKGVVLDRIDEALRVENDVQSLRSLADSDVTWDQIESIESVEPDYDWVYDLEVADTHNYLTNNVVSHNSQMLSYVQNIAPRSVYTSGKGSSSAGLTAAAVRDDFGDGQQWTLEAGALVLADKGVAAVDELDKMAPDDRSAMHEGLEQQKISVSKAGINATLKSRCSLLGAANPKYGRFDQYEPIGEQIDLEPALISRFDLIFTVTDQPDEEHDKRLAEHIIQTNYAGQLNTQRTEMSAPNISEEEVRSQTEEVAPAIDADLLRKYIAYSKRNCFPTMTEEAKRTIEDFYVDLRTKGADEDAPVPVTARKLEALVRLSEASARVRLSDEVETEDAERAVEITRSCLQDIGVDPETGQFDADVVETGQSKSQRDRIKNLKQLISDIEEDYEEGAPVDEVMARADEIGMEQSKAEHEIDKLKQKGEVYEPSTDHLRTT